MLQKNMTIKSFDEELWRAIQKERERQENYIELIASENYASPSVLEAQGSLLTNKYAEGYPNKRYYGGCEFVDQVEQLAIDRAKQLFGADYANVQPHSGSQANAATYMALLEPGNTLLGMDLQSGGHLTHGCSVNFSGKFYKAVSYGVDAVQGKIDFDQVEAMAKQHKPKLIIAGFSAYSRITHWETFRAIADQVGAYLMVDMAHIAGLVATGLHPSPIGIADVVTSTTHKTLRGARGGLILTKNRPEIAEKLNKAIFPGSQGGPLLHAIAGKAVAFKEAMSPEFKIYQQQILTNARDMVDSILKRGYKIVSDGTDTHLFTVNLVDKGITGKDAESMIEMANITANKNTVPNDPQSPFVTSGLRIGTPAVTTRGFKSDEVRLVAEAICDVLDSHGDKGVTQRVKAQMLALCHRFPVYEV